MGSLALWAAWLYGQSDSMGCLVLWAVWLYGQPGSMSCLGLWAVWLYGLPGSMGSLGLTGNPTSMLALLKKLAFNRDMSLVKACL